MIWFLLGAALAVLLVPAPLVEKTQKATRRLARSLMKKASQASKKEKD